MHKTSRSCGYSKRYLQRIINNVVKEEKEKFSMPKSKQSKSEDSQSSEDEINDRFSSFPPTPNVKENLQEGTAGPLLSHVMNEDEVRTEQFDSYSVNSCEIESENSEIENDVLNSESSEDSLSEKSCFSDSEVSNTMSTDEDTEVDTDDDLENRNSTGKSFEDILRNWALVFHITLVALTALLLILQTVVNFSLPLDARTLMGTIRHVKLLEIGGGTYHHFGLERAVRGIVREFQRKGKTTKEIKLVFNIDGLPISNSGTDSLWLILCSEINGDLVYPVGAFCGKSKPEDANEFMREFVEELIQLCKKGLEDVNVSISCECFVCDVPAKSFAFYLRGHTGYNSCSKCEIEGVYIARRKGKIKKKGTVCFPGTKLSKLKTDEGFNRNDYQDVETGHETILKSIPNFGCISGVPLDYMHLVLLGVVKKIIQLWIKGPYKVRLRRPDINKICRKLKTLRYSIPSEFTRRPRSLWEYTHWKATEFRTFLLYAAPVVLKHIPRNMYEHFLLLHTAMSVSVSEILLQVPANIDVCHDILVRFVEDFQTIYGKQYVSHNVHNLLHLCSDMKKFGRLDKFSSFRFENYLSSVKKWIRKGHQPLQQIARRYSEREAHFNNSKIKDTTILQHPHNTGPLIGNQDIVKQQYKILQNKSIKLNCLEPKNSCVLLKDGTFGLVVNIVDCGNETQLIIKKINSVSQLYDNPDSRYLNIHKGILSKETEFSTSLSNVLCKVWRIPTKKEIILLPLQHVA